MKCPCSFTPVLALAGLAALGFGGFNVMKTGCPLGSCGHHSTPAVTTAANYETVPTNTPCDAHPCCSKDSLTADTVGTQVLTVSDKAGPECAGLPDSASAKDCPHMTDCKGTGECPFKSTAEAAPTQVADKTSPETPKN